MGVSVIIAGFGKREASWDRVRDCLNALSAQEDVGQLEVLLCPAPEFSGEVPEDIGEMMPRLRTVRTVSPDVWTRKNEGARASAGSLLVFLDGDCMPQRGWLRSILDTFEYYPEVAVVSGAIPSEGSWWRRILPARTEAGMARRSAANNVAFRREAFLDCPFAEGAGSNTVARQSKALRRAGYTLWTEPAMRMIRDRRGLKQVTGAQADYAPAR